MPRYGDRENLGAAASETGSVKGIDDWIPSSLGAMPFPALQSPLELPVRRGVQFGVRGTNHGWSHVGLLGTKWTMTGPVYVKALEKRGLRRPRRCFLEPIDELRTKGADRVILGCTEIPLIVTSANAPLPVLDSTRFLAKYEVLEALSDEHQVRLAAAVRP